MAFLQVEQLTKVYGSGDAAVRALDGVSLTVERGEFVVVMGPPARASPRCCICWAEWISPLPDASHWTASPFMIRKRRS